MACRISEGPNLFSEHVGLAWSLTSALEMLIVLVGDHTVDTARAALSGAGPVSPHCADVDPGDEDQGLSTEQRAGGRGFPPDRPSMGAAGDRVGHRWAGSLFLAPSWALALLPSSHKAPFNGTSCWAAKLLRRFG